MKHAAYALVACAAIVYMAQQAKPVLETQCRPTVKVYCGQGRVGHKALVGGIIEVKCADESHR